MNNRREQNILIAVFLNLAFTVIEVAGGLWTNSLAILSDALHDFGDSVALLTSWFMEGKAKTPPDHRRTFGYGRLSLFSAVFAAVVLVIGSFFILSAAVPRLIKPEPVYAPGMIGLAVAGLLFNGAGFLRLKRGQSVNEKVLSWHLLDDVLGWAAILIGSVIIQFWNNPVIDPIMTIGFTAFTLFGVARNLKETLNILLQGVPGHIDLQEVKASLLAIEGVRDIHDIHIWSLEGETDIFTGHLVVREDLLHNPDGIRSQVKESLARHHIEHSTIELESAGFCSGIECRQGEI